MKNAISFLETGNARYRIYNSDEKIYWIALFGFCNSRDDGVIPEKT